jgi:paraquat-inducible protein A
VSKPVARAMEIGVLRCLECALVQKAPDASHVKCPRCGRKVRLRKPNSIRRAWAFLIAAAILYVPANLLPIMQTNRLTEHRNDTILSGVAYLWDDGSWDLAAIVFVASVVVPVVKLLALGSVLWSTQRGVKTGRRARATLFHFTEVIGHWSMLDVFVVALLVTLVKFGAFADVEPLSGVVAFAFVVVLTMLASRAFDPRLIWDDPAAAPVIRPASETKGAIA